MDRRLIEDECEILEGVYDHCRKLYMKDPNIANFADARVEVMALITRTFFEEDNCTLKAIPTIEEIEIFLMGFPKGKSSRGDGVTYDFL